VDLPVSTIAPTLADLRVPIESLRPYSRNPRRGNLEAIKASLQAHGQYRPIVARKGSGEVLAGNHTLAAARELGWDSLAATFIEVDDEQAARIVLVDNRTADLGSYDDGELVTLLDSLPGLDGTGWDNDEFDRLLMRVDPERGAERDTDPAEPPEQPTTRAGDLYRLGEQRLLCGDATSAADVQRLMDGEHAALMATDPPYEVGYDAQNHPPSKANRGAANRNKAWAYRESADGSGLYLRFLEVALAEALARSVAIYQWHAGNRADNVIRAWDVCRVVTHQQLVWVKARKVLTYADFMQQHEPCLYGWRQGHRPRRRPPVETPTVWQIDQQGEYDGVHPTQKPLALFARPYSWHLREGQIGYEPFAGSGTALIAAENLGRRCFALEIDPAYCDVVVDRWQRHTGGRAEVEHAAL
jgi:DNA modification methylase